MSQYDDDFDMGDLRAGNASLTYVNEANVPEMVAEEAFRNVDIAGTIERWSRQLNNEMNGAGRGGSGIFNRSRYEMTENVFDQMLQCADAVEFDDILSTVCDTTEGLAFAKMSFECYDEDQEDVWNQYAAEVDLDSKLREMWRELFKVSQVYVGMYWDKRVYTVRTPPDLLASSQSSGNGAVPPQFVQQQNKMKAAAGQGPEGFKDPMENAPDPAADPNADPNLDPADPNADPNAETDEDPNAVPGSSAPKKRKRRKQFSLWVPAELTILDPTKVMPVGQLMFGRERYAYIADENEHAAFSEIFVGKQTDDTVRRMLEGPYTPTSNELELVGVKNASRLWLFRKDAIFRHTLTRSSYERWASVRLKSCLPLLDMKSHLRASDRATLIGATNFIIVLRRGSDAHPAKAGEIAQLQEQARVVARMPILVGPHDLSVDIITPKLDHTLDPDRYNTIDERLIFRALQSFRLGGKQGGGTEDAATMSQVVARGIESRRHELRRTLEAKLFKRVLEVNSTALTERPTMTFHPRRVTLAWDANVINGILKLRDRGDLSRETSLEEFDYDQDVEFLRRAREKETYDSGFKSSVPHGSPVANPFAQPGMPGQPIGGMQTSDGTPTLPTGGRPPGATTDPFSGKSQ